MRDKLAAMNYIIDGHNLIAKIPGLSLSMPDDEDQLITLLSKYGAHEIGNPLLERAGKPLSKRAGRPLSERAGQIEVYFDGAPPGHAGASTYGRVRAYFVQKSSSADEAILERLRRMGKSARSWVVVTSDRNVQAAAHEAHARVMSAEDFAWRLHASLQRGGSQAGNSPDQPLSQAEVDEWLNIFKGRKSTK